ncbi:MAG: class I SAM-dependent methyltransferase [Promethearchaeota archaeon]
MQDLTFYLKNMGLLLKQPFFRRIIFKYLKSKYPITFKDLNIQPKYSSSYALISEKNSPIFKKIMDRLECYIGSGPIGPNKYWEYPWVLTNLKLKQGLSILDVGCGRSPIQFLLSDLGLNVYGVDSGENVQWHGINRKLAKSYGCSIEYRNENGENLSFSNNFFDRVCCVSVIEHCRAKRVDNEQMTALSDDDLYLQRQIVKEMIRVLKPGGICVITVDFFIPRRNVLLESNVDITNLMKIEGAKLIGKKIHELFPGENNFNYVNLIENSDIDIHSYNNLLQTSIGLTLKKI